MICESEWDLVRNAIKQFINSDNFDSNEKESNTAIEYSIWESIDENNALSVALIKCGDHNLFEFLLSKNIFDCANIVASQIQIFNDTNIKLIYDKHHLMYNELLKILCMNKFILLFETYYDRIYDEYNIKDNNNTYRSDISKRYEKMLSDTTSNSIIIELIDEFKFLSHHILSEFVNSLTDSGDEEITYFIKLYSTYKEFIPLINRVINEYYIEYIKYQIQSINDIIGGSEIVLVEYYENILRMIRSIPENYVNYKYQDRFGNNIGMYLAMLPCVGLPNELNNISTEIYREYLYRKEHIDLQQINKNGNTIFHIIANNANADFFKMITEISVISNVSNILLHKNSENKTVFDIILDKNNIPISKMLLDYAPVNIYINLIKMLPPYEIDDYNQIIDRLTNYILKLKRNIMYDISEYNNIKNSILFCFDKLNTNKVDENICLEWLFSYAEINDIDIFSKIIDLIKINNKLDCLNIVQSIRDETILMNIIKNEKNSFLRILLENDINMFVTDSTGKNAFIYAIESKNIYTIHLIKEYISSNSKYKSMNNIFDIYIELYNQNNDRELFTIMRLIQYIWKKIDYFLNQKS